MATKPTSHAEWAKDDLVDPINGLPNKIEPLPAIKLSGQDRAELFSRQNINWLFDRIDDWNKWCEEEIDLLITKVDDTGKVDVAPAGNLTLSTSEANNYYYMSGSTITLSNIIVSGGDSTEVGSTVKVRTTNSTTVSLDTGVTLVGFSGSIPADRIATFTIESLPSGTGTEWSLEVSAGA